MLHVTTLNIIGLVVSQPDIMHLDHELSSYERLAVARVES